MFTGALPATTNRETLSFAVEVFDDETGAPFALTGQPVKVAIRAQNASLPILQGSNSDGHVFFVNINTLSVLFSAAEMQQLAAGQYDVGLTVNMQDGTTKQVLVMTLPVVDGVVQQ